MEVTFDASNTECGVFLACVYVCWSRCRAGIFIKTRDGHGTIRRRWSRRRHRAHSCARLSKALDQQFVVENTSGAGGTIGTAKVAASLPDGYSLLLMHVSHAANVAFYPHLRYEPVKDFEPIGLVAESPMAFVARKDFPANNFKEFVAYVKPR